MLEKQLKTIAALLFISAALLAAYRHNPTSKFTPLALPSSSLSYTNSDNFGAAKSLSPGITSLGTVQGVFGFTNYSLSWSSGISNVSPGATLRFSYVLSNHANFQSVFSSSIRSNWSGGSSEWSVRLVSNDGVYGDVPSGLIYVKNSEINYAVEIIVPASATNGETNVITLSNGIAESAAEFSAVDGSIYGGADKIVQSFVLRTAAPDLKSTKSVIDVSNPSGGSSVQPLSVITYSISYSNAGLSAAEDLSIVETINTNLLYYYTASSLESAEHYTTPAGSSSTTIEYSSDGSTWTNFAGINPTDPVSSSVYMIRFSIDSAAPGDYGEIRYKLRVR